MARDEMSNEDGPELGFSFGNLLKTIADPTRLVVKGGITGQLQNVVKKTTGVNIPLNPLDVKGHLKLGASVVKNPMVKQVAGVAAMIYPPLGVPAAGALKMAEGVLGQINKPEVKAMVNATQVLAQRGDPNAQRAVKLLVATKNAKQSGTLAQTRARVNSAALGGRRGWLVNEQGRISRVG